MKIGAAIPVDILKCTVCTTTRVNIILRVPHQSVDTCTPDLHV